MTAPASDTPAPATAATPAERATGTSGALQGPSALQLALTDLRRQLNAWMRHEPGARLGTDPEELHQLRVAVRHIEATLGLFRHHLSERLLRARQEAKAVRQVLGAVRDFDVQLIQLERYCAQLPAPERGAAAPLRARLEQERGRARMRMIGALDSETTRQWLETLSLESADFAAAGAPEAARAARVMPERVRRRFKKLRRQVRKFSARSTMDDLHAVRRRAKQLRYALECGAVLFGKPAQALLKALRALQEGLGAHQDADMAKNRLGALAMDAEARLPPETLFLMGRLAEHHLEQTARARKTLARGWRKVSGKRWKTLRARMEELAGKTRPPAAVARAALPAASGATPEAVPAPPAPRSLPH